jgi:SAM-dependent methyltransferase
MTRLTRLLGLVTAQELTEAQSRLQHIEQRQAAFERGVDEVFGRAIQELQAWNHQLDERILPAERLVLSSRALPGMADLKLESFEAEHAGLVLGYSDRAPSSDPERAYLTFENTFRGSETLIRERQTIYVPLLDGHEPVLDIGCGRGELLELLRDAEIPARGVDLDPAMVARCHAKGLTDVELGDAVAYVNGLEDSSLGAIVAAQVIEHLPYRELLELMRVAQRKLRPGGRLIVETVNPHAAHALKTFWVDFTHQHPVFPEVVLALCRLSGFSTAYVFHPGGSGNAEKDRFEAGDYTVLAELLAG